MSIAAKARECILGKLDLDALLEHLDPDWKEHFCEPTEQGMYYDRERAFEFYTQFMPLTELRAAIKESGA